MNKGTEKTVTENGLAKRGVSGKCYVPFICLHRACLELAGNKKCLVSGYKILFKGERAEEMGEGGKKREEKGSGRGCESDRERGWV